MQVIPDIVDYNFDIAATFGALVDCAKPKLLRRFDAQALLFCQVAHSWGQAAIQELRTSYWDAMQYMHDQTIRC